MKPAKYATWKLTWEMKDYLEKRREELKRSGESGFTLMEMLIVVAIIAVLIAIAIPVFTTQLERSRDTTSVANMRSAYAEAAAELLVWDGSTYTQANGSKVASMSEASGVVTITVTDVDILSQVANTWSGANTNLPFTVYTDPGTPTNDGTATFTFTRSTGVWALTGVSASATGASGSGAGV